MSYIDELLQNALKFKDIEHNLDLALKYAYQAAAISFSPRADVCCVIGEIYLSKNNIVWAKFWYEKALNNITVWVDEVLPDQDYFTIIPMVKLYYITSKLGEIKEAQEYYSAIKLIDPENKQIEVIKKEFSLVETKEES